MYVERRSNRSRRQDLATRYYLINVTRRHRPRAVVLTDMNGEVVAGVEGKPFMEGGFIASRAAERTSTALARVALEDFRREQAPARSRWVDRVTERVRGLRRRAPRPEPGVPDGARVAQRFEVGGRPYLMVVVGEHGGATISDAIDGLKRILGEPVSSVEALAAEGLAIEAREEAAPTPDVEAISPADVRLRPAAAAAR